MVDLVFDDPYKKQGPVCIAGPCFLFLAGSFIVPPAYAPVLFG